MGMWYSARVVYNKPVEFGGLAKKKELYLVDALSFTEAEARVLEELKENQDIRVTALKIEDVAGIIESIETEEMKLYKVKVNFTDPDGKVITSDNNIVYAASTDKALARIKEHLADTIGDYKIHSITETKYVDVIFYKLDPETEETK